MGIGLPSVSPPPDALPEYSFTAWNGATTTVRFERTAYRGYWAATPRLGGNEAMVAVRYEDALHVMPDPLCFVYANRTGKPVLAALTLVAQAFVRRVATAGRLSPYSGISWPLSEVALDRLALGDYLGFRLRGGVGCVQPIRDADYATAAFYVLPTGVKGGGGPS